MSTTAPVPGISSRQPTRCHLSTSGWIRSTRPRWAGGIFGWVVIRLRLLSPSIRQPSLKMADQIKWLKAKHAKKSERLFVEFHEYCSCALVSNLPNNDSDWPFSKYRAMHCTALRWSVVDCDSAHVYVMCTLLELFVIQCSYLSTLAGRAENVRTTKAIFRHCFLTQSFRRPKIIKLN